MHSDKVGFIGLGNIGKPMAETLVKKGFDVTVYDLRKESVEELTKLGATPAMSVNEVGKVADIVIIMVLDATQAEDVILGEKGVLESAKKGSLILIGSTVDPIFCQRVARIAAEKEVGVLDTPVSGGVKGAEAASLTFMVGGEDDLLAKCRHVLEAMGKNIFHLGGVGMGEAAKLANNIMSCTNYIGAGEAIALAVKAGIDLERFLEVARVSSGNSTSLHKFQNWRKRKVQEPDSLKLTYKDMWSALELGKRLGVRLPHLELLHHLDIGDIIKQDPLERPKSE